MKKVKNLNLVITYIIVVLMIVDSNSIFMTGIAASLLRKFGMLLMAIVVWSLSSRVEHSNRDYKNYIVTLLEISTYLLIYILFISLRVGRESLKASLIIFIKFVLMYTLVDLVYKKEKDPQIFNVYNNTVCIIALISIFFWIFGSQLHVLHPTGVYSSSWSNLYGGYDSKPTYYNIYFETQLLHNVVRNSAIFAEAPMAALTFSVALTLENLYGKKSKFHKLKLLVFTIAILTTLSSTGYICLIINLIYLLLINTSQSKYKSLLRGTILLVGIIIVVCIFIEKLHSHSGSSRGQDYRNAFLAVKKHPFFGVGFGNGFKLKGGIGKFGYSNSFGKVIGEGGIYISILYWLAFAKSFFVALKNKNLQRLFFTIIIVFLFITTIFVDSYLMCFLLALLAFWQPTRKMELVENEKKN